MRDPSLNLELPKQKRRQLADVLTAAEVNTLLNSPMSVSRLAFEIGRYWRRLLYGD